MHSTAMENCKKFFAAYADGFSRSPNVDIVEIGSQDVNGNFRSLAPVGCNYVGVDFTEGRGVDVVLTDPYSLPFDNESVDVVLSSSCFEHSEMFWVVFIEILRVLKPNGLFYLNVPSNGAFHRYPVDCWRFYPDSGRALVSWARRNSLNSTLLESYTSDQQGDIWNDFVAVFLKDEAYVQDFKSRILDSISDFHNGMLYGSSEILRPRFFPEDLMKLSAINQIINNQIKLT